MPKQLLKQTNKWSSLPVLFYNYKQKMTRTFLSNMEVCFWESLAFLNLCFGCLGEHSKCLLGIN